MAASCQHRAIFHLDATSPSICMLIQIEKHATEEDGGTASVYSRKEPVGYLNYSHKYLISCQ